jgi:monovalent cation:H+ antiporter, CPA1 family
MSDVVTIHLGLILLVAAVVAMISRRMRLPYSVGLVAAGVLLAQAPIVSGVLLSPEGIYTILLPPLIFQATLQIWWSPFRRDLPVILTFAFADVTVAAITVAAGIHFLVGWSWIGGNRQPLAAAFGLWGRPDARYCSDQRQGSRVSIWRIGWSAMRLRTSAR